MATALQHTTGSVPTPSALVPGIAPELDEVVRIATQRDPAARYPDAGAFRVALDAAVPSGPLPVDLRGGRHHTVVMPAFTWAPNDEDTGATRVVLRTDPPEVRTITPRRRRGRVLLLALVLLLVAGSSAAAFYNFVAAPVRDLPNVVGMTPAAAATMLLEGGFDSAVADRGVNSTSVEVGRVAITDPAGRARKGSLVTLALSLGPAEVMVPDVTAMDEQAASAQLRAANFEVAVEYIHDDLVAEGLAVRTDPPGDTAGLEQQTVTLFVSLGPAPVQVPGVVGMTLEQALDALGEVGLEGEVVEERFDEAIAAGSIVEQLPGPGDSAHRGDLVQLVVSKGGRPFALPDVRGQKEQDARRALEDLGLEVDVEEVGTIFGNRRGRVADTNPPPGTTVRSGDSVVLFVYD